MDRPVPEAEVITEGLGSPEGPDLLPDGRVVFVETFRCRVSSWDQRAGLRQYAYVGGAPNACAVGLDGVYVTQTGATAGPWRSPDPVTPSIQRINDDGSVETVLTAAGGEALRGPNDLAFGPDGRLYFTDPGIFDPEQAEPGRICVADPVGETAVIAEVGRSYPNGIVVEPDGSVVWNESFTRQVRRWRPGGEIELLWTAPEDRILDGMKAAEEGSLYVTGVTSGGIDVLEPDGEHVGFVDTGGQPLNCVFSGTDLLVADYGTPQATAGQLEPLVGRLLRVPVGVRGRELYRGSVGA